MTDGGLILACDPGLRKVGVSLWDGGGLVRASLVQSPERVLRGPGAWEAMAQAVREEYPFELDALVVEVPQYDSRTPQAVVDVFEVFGVAINLVGAFRTVSILPTVRVWKGSMEKSVTQARVLLELGPSGEFDHIEDPWSHDCLDGVALGLWHVSNGNWRRDRND